MDTLKTREREWHSLPQHTPPTDTVWEAWYRHWYGDGLTEREAIQSLIIRIVWDIDHPGKT